MNRIRWYGPTLALLMTVLLVMFSGPHLVRNIVFAREQAEIRLASDALDQSEMLVQLSQAFRKVADAVRPSVVSIHTFTSDGDGRSRSWRLPRMPRFHPDLMPEDLFQRPREEDSNEYEKYDRTPQSTGSGWVYDAGGHIVTNYHVIEGADKIEVHFANGDERAASVVGVDPDTDVAVIKVDDDHLHPARIAEEPAQQGDMVFAFGSPLRFEFSMSQGVVSATGRQLNIIGRQSRQGPAILGYENFIQTDAAINQGNSGGPLTNIFGRLVGMNTAIATRNRTTGGFMGLGFAIPIDMVRDVVEKILRHGKVDRGYLGVTFQEIDAQQAATYGFEGAAVVVLEPMPDGPAQKAGIRTDDLLTRVNGERITSGDALRGMIAGIEPGTQIKVEVYRDNELVEIPVVLESKPAELTVRGTGPNQPRQRGDAGRSELLQKLGITAFRDLDRRTADALGIDYQSGVLVERVRGGSIAAEARLRPGHVIVKVMNTPVASASDLVDAMEAHADVPILRLSVVGQDGRRGIVWLEMPED